MTFLSAQARASTGQVQTVLGPAEPSALGPTTMHEHLLLSLDCYLLEPEEASARGLAAAPASMDALGDLPGRWRHHRPTMNLVDERAAAEEAMEWRLGGGGTIVDATSIGIARDPLALARISRATGLNIVMGAGYYVPVSHPPEMDGMTEDEITRRIIGDVAEGVGDTGIRSGIIGEIGCVSPPTDSVQRVLGAAARAQAETGAAVLVHPGHGQRAPAQILDLLVRAGADPSRVVLGHLDARIADPAVLADLAAAGTYLEFDTFGIEHGGYAGDPTAIPMPTDAGRIDMVGRLIELGHRDQVVIAHDVCHGWRHVRLGGTGYGHLLSGIVPRMRSRGFGEEDIEAVLVHNPARALALA